jgi:hypothetical protein
MGWGFLKYKRGLDVSNPYYGGTSHAAPARCLAVALALAGAACVYPALKMAIQDYSEPKPPAATVPTLPPAAAKP